MIKEEKRFYIEENANIKAEIGFELIADVVYINSTITKPEFQGQGLAGMLTQELVNYAKENNYTVVPRCSYAQRYFEKNPDLEYLLEK